MLYNVSMNEDMHVEEEWLDSLAAGPLVRENLDRGKPFWGKIGAKSGQNPAKFGAKSGKSEQIGIKTEVNYPNIPGIQP